MHVRLHKYRRQAKLNSATNPLHCNMNTPAQVTYQQCMQANIAVTCTWAGLE